MYLSWLIVTWLVIFKINLIEAQVGEQSDSKVEVIRRADVNPSCLLPKFVGKCRGAFEKWYFNVDTWRCDTFIYGGCDGNANNFPTQSECEQKCLHDAGTSSLNSTSEKSGKGPCADKVRSTISASDVGQAVPQCSDRGYYNLIQCHGSTGYCYCVNVVTGVEVRGTRKPAGVAVQCPNCHVNLDKALRGHTTNASLQCTDDGFYAAMQCDATGDECWCVNQGSGEEVAGSLKHKSLGRPTCAAFAVIDPPASTANPIARTVAGPCKEEYDRLLSASNGVFPPGANAPQCTQTGFYELKQCATTAQCWCVDPLSGAEAPGTKQNAAQNNGNSSSCGACHVEKAKAYANGQPLLGAFIAQCTENGGFLPTQCHGSTGYCWCVDENGKEIPGTRKGRGSYPQCSFEVKLTATTPSTSTSLGPCAAEQQAWTEQGGSGSGARGPLCMPSGYYELVQCNGVTTECWCADATTGKEIASTRVRGPVKPQCSVCHKNKAEIYRNKEPAPGAFVPQCHDSGYFEPMQCHGSNGYCWCVNPNSGEELAGTRQSPTQGTPNCTLQTVRSPPVASQSVQSDGPDGPCHAAVKGIKGAPGAYVPTCTEAGYYHLVQCHGSTGQCWCVDPVDGNETSGTRVKAGQTASCPECLQRKADAYQNGNPPPGAFAYACQKSGEYLQRQCHGSSGHCWCVDVTSGQELLGTRTGPGQGLPNCTSSERTTDFDRTTDSDFDVTNTSCLQERDQAIKNGLIGSFVPSCTENGKYNPLQCHASTGHCFCVHTESGVEVPGSRIGPGLRTPRCGECLKYLNSIASGTAQRPDNVPRCDSHGDFVPLQCNGSRSECWCVAPDSGTVIAGTKRPIGVQEPTCQTNFSFRPPQSSDKIESPLSIDVGPVFPPKETESTLLPLLPGGIQGPGPVIPPASVICSQPKQRGTCNEKAVKWYFDTEKYECLAFAFTGCGGNMNMFDSQLTCSGQCKLPDGQSCSGNTSPYMNTTTGQLQICNGPTECPKGFSCRRGAFFGSCCNSTSEDLYEKNYRPSCKRNLPVVQMDLGGFPVPLLGALCSDDFCPSGTTCEQGEIFAYCCGDAPVVNQQGSQQLPSNDPAHAEPKQSEPSEESHIPESTVRLECSAPKDSGNCSEQQLSWFFNPEHHECLAFMYTGCGGNSNRHQTLQSCEMKCKPLDGPTCSGNKDPYYDTTTNSTRVCKGKDDCPAGWVCQMGAFFGSCCNATTEDLYARNYRPTCSANQTVHGIKSGGFKRPLLGDQCSDGFCPEGTTCEQGEIFAHCCGGTLSGSV